MPIAALIALLPAILQGAGEVANIIQEMNANNQTETTAEQDARLAAALDRRRLADAGYDALPQA